MMWSVVVMLLFVICVTAAWLTLARRSAEVRPSRRICAMPPPSHPNVEASVLRLQAIIPMRDSSVQEMPALAESVARALRAAGAVIIRDPSPLFLGPPTDFAGPVSFGGNELWLAFYFLEARQNNQFFCVTLRAPLTGPPGVDLAPPLEDTAATRSALEVVARALASCHEHVRWCAQDEATDFVLYTLDSSPLKP